MHTNQRLITIPPKMMRQIMMRLHREDTIVERIGVKTITMMIVTLMSTTQARKGRRKRKRMGAFHLVVNDTVVIEIAIIDTEKDNCIILHNNVFLS